MREETVQSLRSSSRPEYEQDPELSLADAIRFLRVNRARLVRYFAAFAAVGVVGFFPWRLSRPRKMEGRVALNFNGIEKGEYPNGKRFNVEDFRIPSVMRAALIDAGIPRERVESGASPVDLVVSPIIPAAVSKKWEKQEKEGVKKEDYFPSEFALSVDPKALTDAESRRFFDALIRRYREHVKQGQMTALRLTTDFSKMSDVELLRDNEYADIPRIMEQSIALFNDYLDALIDKSNDYSDPELRFAFSDIRIDLKTWSMTRLETLKAMSSTGKLVKNKSAALMRARYRLEDLKIQIRQRTEEMAQAVKLLETIPRNHPVLAAQKPSKDEVPTIDASVLDKLMSLNYIAPIIKRISDLQAQTKTIEAEKWRLERDLDSLPSARNVEPKDLPRDYVATVSSALTELQRLIIRYNQLINSYIDSAVTNRIVVTGGPTVRLEAPSVRFALAMIALVAALLAFLAVGVENVYRTAFRG